MQSTLVWPSAQKRKLPIFLWSKTPITLTVTPVFISPWALVLLLRLLNTRVTYVGTCMPATLVNPPVRPKPDIGKTFGTTLILTFVDI